MKTLPFLLFLALLPACSFLEAAADVPIGDSVPHAQFLLKWPNVDQLVGGTLDKAGGGKMPDGFPKSLASGSLAHVQGLMTIDGECKRTFDQAVVDEKTTALRNLHVEVVNCGTEGRCTSSCIDEHGDPFRGVRLNARVQFNLVNADVAAKVGKVLNDKTDPDAISRVTLRFSKLEFIQDFTDPATGKTGSENIDNLFSGYQLGVGSVYDADNPTPTDGTNDDTVIVKQQWLAAIANNPPQRFELDPTSDFSLKLRKAIIGGKQVWITVFQRIDVPEQNLYGVRMGTGGVNIDFQPEIVISGLKAVSGAL